MRKGQRFILNAEIKIDIESKLNVFADISFIFTSLVCRTGTYARFAHLLITKSTQKFLQPFLAEKKTNCFCRRHEIDCETIVTTTANGSSEQGK